MSLAVKDVVTDEAEAEKIIDTCEEKFENEPPSAGLFVDKKALKSTEGERREKELIKEIEDLKVKLKNADSNDKDKDSVSEEPINTDTVSIIIPSERRETIRFEEIDGSRYVLIPLSDEEEPEIKTT